MLPAILVVGLSALATYKGLDLIAGKNEKNSPEKKEEEGSVSVPRVLGTTLPERREPLYIERQIPPAPVPIPLLRPPGVPLWENHRLYEGLYDLPLRARRINGIIPLLREEPMENIHIPINRSSEALFNNHLQQRHGLEDPFAEETHRGWTYHGGQRQQR